MIAILILAASMIAANLVRTNGLVMDRYLFKPLKKVNGESVKVIGSVTFEVIYEDSSIEIVALVGPEIEDEMILSWRTLRDWVLSPIGSQCRTIKLLLRLPKKNGKTKYLSKFVKRLHTPMVTMKYSTLKVNTNIRE